MNKEQALGDALVLAAKYFELEGPESPRYQAAVSKVMYILESILKDPQQ